MSLLNEALRKNKLENSERISRGYSSRDTSEPKSRVSYFILLSAVIITGFLFSWIIFNNDSKEAGNNNFKITVNESIPEDVQKSVPVITEPAITMELSKETKDISVLHDMETVNEKPDKKSEQVSVKSESRIHGVHRLNDEKKKVDEAVKARPAYDEGAYYKKAVQFHRQGSIEKAISMYREVLSINPEHFDSQFNLASIYITRSKFHDAYTILTELVSSNPSDPKTRLNLAVAEIGLGKSRDALFILQDIDENDIELRYRVEFHKGVAHSRLGEQEKALNCYKKAEKLDNGNPALLLNMAVLYDRLKNFNEAIKYYFKVINSNSADPDEKEKLQQRAETLQKIVSDLPDKNLQRADI